MHPVLKKLQYKSQEKVLVLNAPESFNDIVRAFSVSVQNEPSGKYSFVMVFLYQQSEFDDWLPLAIDALLQDAFLWVCYPQKSSPQYQYQSDINRDCGWAPLTPRGFEGVRMVAIDEDWSALRFRDVDHIPAMSRKTAISDKGRKRISTK